MPEYPPDEKYYMPASFAASLATDTSAIDAFSKMTLQEQDELISRARAAESKEEMEQLINCMFR